MDVCVYCGAPAETRDHVPPKCFLEEGEARRATVPACLACNRRFSMHEQYTIALLAQIGTSRALGNKVDAGGAVDRAFERSPAFEQRFIDRLSVDESGRVLIEPEVERVELVLRKVVAGLYRLRYGRTASMESLGPVGFWPYNLDDQVPVQALLEAYTERFKPKRWAVVQRGVFEYMFVRRTDGRLSCVVRWHETLWVTCIVPWPRGRRADNETNGQGRLPID